MWKQRVIVLFLFPKQVSGLRSLFGKIATFPKKQAAFTRWLNGESFENIAKNAHVAEATAQIYVIDMIAEGIRRKDLHVRLIRELDIQYDSIEEVHEILCRGRVTLRELKDTTQLTYNQIRAIIALFINGHEL